MTVKEKHPKTKRDEMIAFNQRMIADRYWRDDEEMLAYLISWCLYWAGRRKVARGSFVWYGSKDHHD